MASDLIVDPQIRFWVFLPIVLVTFLVGLIKHYTTQLIGTSQKPDLRQIQETHLILRVKLLKENGSWIPGESFDRRRQALERSEEFLVKTEPKHAQNGAKNPFDPSSMTDMVKGNLTSVLPMLAIGGLINWLFSGFITAKVPFPLTLPFKSMLQRGIELNSLDASWVSSASWYFLNAFGLNSIYLLLLGEEVEMETDRYMENMGVNKGAQLSEEGYREEIESLLIMEHEWDLENLDLVSGKLV